MMKLSNCKRILGGILVFVTACTANYPKMDDYSFGEKPDLVFETNPEPVDGKMDVYDAIARAVKYNVDVVGRSLHQRVNEANKGKTPEQLMEKIANANVKDENVLYKGLRMLDFALIYASVNLGASQRYADNYFYEMAAKYLTLEAIRAHQSVWFANKKEKNINALLRQEQKIVNQLNQKELQKGVLTDEEYDYNKNQKVLLLKLSELWNKLNGEWNGYVDLVKLDPPQVELEGRRFYALENFDEDYNLELFQEAAVRNRKEFALAKEYSQLLPYSQVRRYISNKYPPVARLDVNGVKVEYDIYKQELYEKAANIALELVSLVYEYKNSKSPLKDGLLRRIFDEYGAAVLTQVELSYQLVLLADYDYENIITAENNHKKEIQRLKKIRNPSNEDKLALFRAKITELHLEQRKSQILAERAEALRGLYFNVGLSPIQINMMKIPVKEVALAVKKSFNQDLVDMLAGVKLQLKQERLIDGKQGWASASGWLENVVADDWKKKNLVKKQENTLQKSTIIEKPKPIQVETIVNPDPKLTEKKEKLKIMQLGAYLELKNADDDWQELITKFEDLKKYKKIIEKANVNGKEWLRLQVSGKATEIERICNKIKKQGYGCILK